MKSDLNKVLKSGGYIVAAYVLSCMTIPQTQKLFKKKKKKKEAQKRMHPVTLVISLTLTQVQPFLTDIKEIKN